MAYKTIKSTIEKRKNAAETAKGAFATSLGAVGIGAASGKIHPLKSMDQAKALAKLIQSKGGMKNFSKFLKQDGAARTVLHLNKDLIFTLASAAGVIATGFGALRKGTGSDKKAVIDLVRMTEQGDIDPTDLVLYAKTAVGREKKIVNAALAQLGYNYETDSPEQFISDFRKNKKRKVGD